MLWRLEDNHWCIDGKYKSVDWSHIDFNIEHKNRCPVCASQGRDNSGDNLHVYGLGYSEDYGEVPLGAKCFGLCGTYIPPYELVVEQSNNLTKGVKEVSRMNLSSNKLSSNVIVSKNEQSLKDKSLTPEQLEVIFENTSDTLKAKYRGLTDEFCKQYGVRWVYSEMDGQLNEMWTPYHIKKDGELIITGYKIRMIRDRQDKPLIKGGDNVFRTEGYVGKLNCFFGEQFEVSGAVICVGGEVDCITTSQILKKGLEQYPSHKVTVVCAGTGEASTAEFIKQNYEWLVKHKKIILCLDNDDAGKKAQKDAIAVLPSELVYEANLAFKDANEYLNVNINTKGFTATDFTRHVYWDAKPLKNYGVIGSSKLYNKAIENLNLEKIPLPKFLKDLDSYFVGGIALSEIINIVSSTSTGKSVIVGELILDWIINSPYKMLIASYEDNAGGWSTKIASRIIGVKLSNISSLDEQLSLMEEHRDKINQFFVDEDGDDRFVFMEDCASDLESFKESVLYAIRVLGVKVVIIDPLISLIGEKSLEEQSKLMNWQEECRRLYKTTFINVCHTRKKSVGDIDGSNGGDLNESDIRGSSQIGSTATVNMILKRNKMSDDPTVRNTTIIDLPKNRTSGLTGKGVAKIFYHNESHTLMPYSYAESNNFFKDKTPELIDIGNKDSYIVHVTTAPVNHVTQSEVGTEVKDLPF